MDRFIDKVLLMPNDCWQWTGSLVQAGYGQIKVKGAGYRAHRVSYELFIGPIPDDLPLDHLCRNRGCVNPAHLEAVPMRENILRGENNAARNARKTHCDQGHEFTPENTYHYPGRNKRACKTCLTAWQLARKGLDSSDS